MEKTAEESTPGHVSVKENFSITAKTGDKGRAVIIDLLFLFPCLMYILWNRNDFELIYQVIAIMLLLFLIPDFLSTMLRKVTVDFQTISVRNALGIIKTYEIRQITKVTERKTVMAMAFACFPVISTTAPSG